MYKKLLIMPYFGTFPPYIRLWIDSCEKNPDFDWLVVTDNAPPCTLPGNMKWVQKQFDELREDFQRKFSFKLWLKKPYKLCDYKGFYGYLFSEYLQGYDFWGYCDCDVIFGQLHKFLPDELLSQYDKLLKSGHLSLIRNTPQINENFRNYDAYRLVLSSPVIYGYDEAVDGFRKGLSGELIASGYRFFEKNTLVADIDFRHYPFRVVSRPEKCCIFGYRNGELYQFIREEAGVQQEEAFYLHLQKRKMNVPAGLQEQSFLVYPNTFASWDGSVPADSGLWEAASREQADYFDYGQEKRKELRRDIHRLLREPNVFKALRYRFFGK